MALDPALPQITIEGAQQAIAGAVQTARDAYANNEISAADLALIKSQARLTDAEVDNIIANARERLGL